MLRKSCLGAAVGIGVLAFAQTARAADDPAVSDVVVTAARLNAARQSIQPSLGATTYSVTNETIQALPGADDQQLNLVVLQLPGVVQDGFGQLHIRDDHNNIQYRLNGTILPEGISVFGQTLSPRLVGKLSLITGAMPAQYGLRTAGVIDIQTKSGLFHNGGQVSLYGGSHGLYQPSFEYGGSAGETNFFVSGEYKRSQLGIESVDGSSTPDHDRTDQANLFAYGDRILGPNDRISFVGGYSNARFQIPNPRGLQPDGTYTLNGQTEYPSELLDETQRETTGYGIISYLHDSEKWTLQTSLTARYSTLTYRPDIVGELLYNGIAQYAAKRDFAAVLQSEGVYRLTDAHTLRGGIILQNERGESKTTSQVFPVDGGGVQIGDSPATVIDDGGETQWTYSAYVQDEWKLLSNVTLNYGLRFDAYDGYRRESQVSPRVNLVWQAADSTAFHAGYARYFTPPPFENVAGASIAKFVGTSAEAPTMDDTTPYAERQDYYDVGVEQKIGGHFTLGVDGYYRKSKNLIDEGQFGAPIILTPFNYAQGKIHGVEVSATYAAGPLNAYVNFAYAKAQGKDIVSSQFSFDPGDLAYIANHYIYLDHDQTYTASAGASYAFSEGTTLSADAIYGSGLRTDGAAPNGDALKDYVQVNLSATQKFDLPFARGLEARLDVINVFDRVYEIRDGGGVGVGAPEYGPRRGFFVGLTKSF
jgi:outer membrane receptor for ferrienterochelin and colicins